jgi:hypothetical protein
MLTNDEYHDILDAIKAAKADFRYANTDSEDNVFEVEAYQISARSRFENNEWPPWLQMQKRPQEVNRVYCESHSPNDLTLMMSDGSEQPLGPTDWLVLYKNGDITVLPERDFTHFNKVVPVPDAPVIGEELAGFEEKWEVDENNKLIPRVTPLKVEGEVVEVVSIDESTKVTPEMISSIVSRDYEEMEEAIGEAIDHLQEDQPKPALAALKGIMQKRTVWCNCVPGSCDDSETFGCREKSPLLK